MGKSVVQNAGQAEYYFEKKISKKVSMKYLLHLPEGYADSNDEWPLILFLHGAGERGSDLDLVKLHGPPKIVSNNKNFPFVVLSPQCPKDLWWPQAWVLETVYELLKEIDREYRIDSQRIYLTGLSMGGFGTWQMAITHPDAFAAIAPICGGGIPWLACNIKNLPVWVFHGAKDEVVPIEKSREMVEALRECGGDVKFTTYPEAAHDSWTTTYEKPDLYTWFLQHVKNGSSTEE